MWELKRYKYQITGGLILAALLGVSTKANVGIFQESAEDLPYIHTRHQFQQAREFFSKDKDTAADLKSTRDRDLRPFILRTVRRGLPRQYKHYAFDVARTVISEANHYKMDPLFLLAVITTESKFNPDARGTHGEIGLMQVLPSTAAWLATEAGMNGKIDLRDPAVNIRIGATYFAQLRKNFKGRSRLYVSAYNMGSTNVRRLLASNVQPKEYSNRVIGHYTKFYQTLNHRNHPVAITTRHAAGLAQK